MALAFRALTAAFLLAAPASTLAQANIPDAIGEPITMTADFNYITRAVNHWEATGAFQDSGTISNGVNEVFKGQVAKVSDTIVAQEGTIKITFSKAFSQDVSTFGGLIGRGEWNITGGTGKYEGMTGKGTLRGTLNVVTGAIHDVFEGRVVLQP